jgi:sugar phosphate permease
MTPDSSYTLIAIGVAIMGLGMGAVTGPTGESIMSVLPREQAGAGSAINDTVQELGGTLGVAIIGSIVSASYRHGIDTSDLPAHLRQAARPDIAAADTTAAHAGPLAGHVIDVAHQSFTTAMTHGFLVAGCCALIGAIAVAFVLPGRLHIPIHISPERDTEPESESVG